jgi:hypothetical protein
MSAYTELKARHQKEVNNFPMFFAFSNEQFNNGMLKIGLHINETDKIVSIGAGGFIRKDDVMKWRNLIRSHNQEMFDNIEKDKDGTGFILDMFKYELANHEFNFTGDIQDTLDCLGLDMDDFEKYPQLKVGINRAIGQLNGGH